MTYNLYNMRGYILLYEKEAKRIQKGELLPPDLQNFEFVGSYRRWAKKNKCTIRCAGRYFAHMKRLGLLQKHNRKNYLAKERPQKATIEREVSLPYFLRCSTKNKELTRCQKN